MKKSMMLSALLLLLMLLAACGAAESPTEPGDGQPVLSPLPTDEVPPPPIEESPVAEPAPENGETGSRGLPDDAAMEGVISQVMDQLAAQTGLTPEEMTVVSAEAVEWSDSSLGCPDPATMYMQVIIPGYRVVIEGNGETFDIGTDQEVSRLAICPKEG